MKIDPKSEAEYRAKLARGYLERAEKFLSTGDYRECVEASQLAVENAAKAVVALMRIPSWSRDPSDELMELIGELPGDCRGWAVRPAGLARELAPEHGVVTYGKPVEGLAPWELYGEPEASAALGKADEAVKLMERLLQASI
ncbi:MAG: HEPN domain-containing protein [Candidatus Bathyarchaeia archaeon]